MYSVRVLPFHTLGQWRSELAQSGVHPPALADHLAKGVFRALFLERVSPLLAQFLYQELVLEGGDAVISSVRSASAGADRGLDPRVDGQTDVLLLGTEYQLHHLITRIRTQVEGSAGAAAELALLADELERALDAFDYGARGRLTVRGTDLQWGRRTYVMGILNLTPDSFSGDGMLAGGSEDFIDRAVARAEQMVVEGADILDVGGESTRPGSQPTPAEEEYRRVIPTLGRLRARLRIPISVDTYKADIARAALDAGADLLNDVWGLRMDPEIKRVVAERGVPVVIMHNRSRPKDAAQSERLGGHYVGVEYADLLGEVIGELRDQVQTALEAGIAADKIIVDPGIGFGKTVEQNLELVNRLDELRVLGYPILLGPSRKGFIGFTLDLPADQRVEGTAAAVAAGIVRGADIVRVHDVQAMTRVARMTDAITRGKPDHSLSG